MYLPGLDQAMKDADKTVDMIAMEMHIDRQTAVDWRKCRLMVPGQQLQGLAFRLGVSPEFLMGKEHKEFSKPIGSITAEDISSTTPRSGSMKRPRMQFSEDGMPMLPSFTKTRCSCGKVVNP